jgi:hypothetical protein
MSAAAKPFFLAPENVATATRDCAIVKSAGKPQSVPGGQDKLKVIEAEARETDKALKEILVKLGV